MNKILSLFGTLLLSMLLLTSCGKKAAITGKVVDITGEGLDSVTVAIEKSAFKTITDKQGNYSIEYAPGNFKLTYSKPSWTSHELELNLSTEMKYPAEIVELCPSPAKKGIYLLEGSKIVPLNEVLVEFNKIKQGTERDLVRYSINDLNKIDWKTKIKAGNLNFLDSYPEPMQVARLHDEGYWGNIQEYSYNWFRRGDVQFVYNGFTGDSYRKAGKANMLIRSIKAQQGIYVWIQVHKGFGGVNCPAAGTKAFLFKVDSSE